MFEQTLLTHPPSGQKSRAIAASFMAQMALLGVLLVAPLLYTQVLPLVLPAHDIPVPIFRSELPAQPEAPAAAAQAASPAIRTLSRPKAFAGPVVRSVPTGLDTGPDGVQIGDIGDVQGPGVETGPRGPTSVNTSGFNSTLPAAVAEVKPAVVTQPPTVPPKPLAVNGGVQAAKLLTKVVPVYPSFAKQARIQGTVRLLALIGKDGRIIELRTIDGHPLLRRAAEDAVRQWVYSPTLLSGVAMEVETSIDVHFSLQ